MVEDELVSNQRFRTSPSRLDSITYYHVHWRWIPVKAELLFLQEQRHSQKFLTCSSLCVGQPGREREPTAAGSRTLVAAGKCGDRS